MHELSIAQSILDTVVAQTQENHATRVLTIRLRVGELTAIVDDALTFAFEVLARDTCARNARIEIDHVAWTVRCPACRRDYHVTDGFPVCECGHVGGETIAGRELQILEMDVE